MFANDSDPGGMDPKLAAMMNKIEKKGKNKDQKGNDSAKDAPVKSYEDFCRMEKLEDWPYRMTSEGPLGIEGDTLGLGSKDDIVKMIKEAAPINLDALDDLEEKLTELEKVLKAYADKLVTDEHRESPSELQKWLMSPMKSTDGSETSRSHGSKAKKKTFSDSVAEMRKRSIEYCSFPGFRKGELTELPSQLESPQILHRVTKTQDFNPGFKKFWQKIFLSEASVAIMQDLFWWFFLDNFERNRKAEQTLLFDRIADSFAALFNSINPEIKDKFFQVYDNCLAQAVFTAYYEAFPESHKQFDDDFKSELIGTASEWISGVRPQPEVYKSWNIKRLTRKSLRPGEDVKNVSKMASAAALSQDGLKVDLDIDGFERMVNKLGESGPGISNSRQNTAEQGAIRPVAVSGPAALPSQSIQPLNMSRLAQCGTPRKFPKESHTIGPGPKFERVMFDTMGRSPLIAHYLHRRQLQDIKRPELKVKRTEVVSLPQDAPTYRDLINNRIAMSDTLSKEYQRICDQTNQEILRIEKKKLETNREIEHLKKAIMFNRNPIDLKIMSEKILEMRERDTPTALHSVDMKTIVDEESDESD